MIWNIIMITNRDRKEMSVNKTMGKKVKPEKTNAMRELDSVGIEYDMSGYDYDEKDLSGRSAAIKLNVSEDQVFKTLVTAGNDGEHYVFVLPSSEELDLKKAAKAAGIKRIDMIHVNEIFQLTGYLRGGCSPIGMKKKFTTFIDENALLFDKIYISAGKRGEQIIIDPEKLANFIGAEILPLVK